VLMLVLSAVDARCERNLSCVVVDWKLSRLTGLKVPRMSTCVTGRGCSFGRRRQQ
jgi:hypothetical protein